jgi:hypothetical protein
MSIIMAKAFLLGIKIQNKSWKTRNLLIAKSTIKTLRDEDRNGDREAVEPPTDTVEEEPPAADDEEAVEPPTNNTGGQ